MSFVDKAKGFLLSPTETFRESRKDTIGEGIKYAIAWFAILGLLAGIVLAVVWSTVIGMVGKLAGFGSISALGNLGYALIPIMIVWMVVVGVVGLLIGGAWVHLWVYVCGGRKGYSQTVKALAYGGTPSYVLGWIPFLNFIGGLWSLILGILGIRELHEISTGRAVAAVLISAIIPLTLVVIAIAVYYTTSV